MSLVKVSGNASGTGTLTIAAPNTNSDRTLTLPDGTGTFTVNGVNSNIVSGTAVASTSGTSIDFTGIPSWVKRITVMFNNVSTSGTSFTIVQIGSGSVDTASYVSTSGTVIAGTPIMSTATNGFVFGAGSASDNRSGHIVLTLFSSNLWIESHSIKTSGGGTSCGGGDKTLSGTLDRVRITTVNGTDTFDAGSINILYE